MVLFNVALPCLSSFYGDVSPLTLTFGRAGIPQVNDLPLRGLTSEQVIELLRKTKGAISLAVVRP